MVRNNKGLVKMITPANIISGTGHYVVSQDNIFHTLPGMLNVETRQYQPALDMIRSCRASGA